MQSATLSTMSSLVSQPLVSPLPPLSVPLWLWSSASEQDSELSMIGPEYETSRTDWFEEEQLKRLDEQRAAAGLPLPSPLHELLIPVLLPAHPLRDVLALDASRESRIKTQGRYYSNFGSDKQQESKQMTWNRGELLFHARNKTNVNSRVDHARPALSPPLTASKTYPRTPPTQEFSLSPHPTSTTAPPPPYYDLSLPNVSPEYGKEFTDHTITFNLRLPNRTTHLYLVCTHTWWGLIALATHVSDPPNCLAWYARSDSHQIAAVLLQTCNQTAHIHMQRLVHRFGIPFYNLTAAKTHWLIQFVHRSVTSERVVDVLERVH